MPDITLLHALSDRKQDIPASHHEQPIYVVEKNNKNVELFLLY